MTQIAVLGEALIDMTAGPDLAFQGHPGGSPMNTAVASARLGARTALLAQLSSDFLGDALHRHLTDNGVLTDWIERCEAPTTLAFVDRQPHGNRYAFYVQGCADGLWNPALLPCLPAQCRFVCHGSFSLLREPAGPRILAFVAREAPARVIVLDPNVRPSLIESATDYRRRFAQWLAHTHLLKLSDEDAEFIAPGQPISVLAEQWFAAGVRAVVVTRGALGASLIRPGCATIDVTPPQITLADTIGAGDTLTAALMNGLLEHGVEHADDLSRLPDARWRNVLEFACAAAALNCAQAGANPPSRAQVLAVTPIPETARTRTRPG